MSKILLVDDDAVIVEIYRKKLAQEGFDVETAPDGLEAVKALHKAKPDLMVLDLMMPRFSGFEVLKYIRTQASLRDLRVVVLSNFYVGGEQHREVAAQANAALLKAQCRPATLVETINQVLTQAVTAPAAQPIAAPASAAPAP